MFNCQQVEKLIDDYLQGDLTASEKELFLGHLAGCLACENKVTAEESILSTLKSLPPYVPSDLLVRNTMRKILSYHRPVRSAFFSFLGESPRPIFNIALACALVVLMALNVNIYFKLHQTSNSDLPTVAYKSLVPNPQAVKFIFNIPEDEKSDIRNVSVVRDFNSWNPAIDNMKYDNNLSAWTLSLEFRQGNYEYM